jgi:hypothetical protein
MNQRGQIPINSINTIYNFLSATPGQYKVMRTVPVTEKFAKRQLTGAISEINSK